MEKIARSLAGLHLPRYQELPQMGLYLEQTATYINEALAPLENVHLTPVPWSATMSSMT